MSKRALSTDTDDRLILPKEHAAETVTQFFEGYGVDGAAVKWTPEEAAEFGVDLPVGCWLIVLPENGCRAAQRVLPRAEFARLTRVGRWLTLVQPTGVLTVKGQSRRRLLRALESARPLQANGLPFPWVPPAAPTQPLGRSPDDDDVVIGAAPAEDDGDAEPTDAARDAPLSTAMIREDFERIRAHLGLPALPLVIRRGAQSKQGFVTGRVHLRADGRATRMVVTTCPNADRAETAATLIHEFAHIVVGVGGGHGLQFKTALVDLAGAVFGVEYFASARQAVTRPSPIVDGWIATGIRAALAGRPTPTAVHPEEAQAAVVVRRVQKLRALAHDQRGTPEGAAAAARANDLIVTHGLGGYQVELPGDLGAQLCDQWIHVGERVPWKVSVAFTVAAFSDVFALHSSGYAGMHLFGRYADVVTAAWLYTVATERIEARCVEHMRQWRAASRPGAASERASFRNSAAIGLRESLTQAKVDAEASPQTGLSTMQNAEEFARVEHAKRGSRWSGGGRRSVRLNAAGHAAGSAITLSKGVGGRTPKGLLR